jgi:hypothetical protein
VAVKVTDCPKTAGLVEELSVVVVAALFTFSLQGEATLSLALKVLSPP